MARDAKRPEDRQRRNLPTVLDAGEASDPARVVPDPPAGLSGALRAAWDGLWRSPVAQLLDPVSDYPAVSRLFGLYLLGERMDARLSAPVDEDGSSFESMSAARVRVASECRLLEGQLGLSPRSRLALGLALLAGRKQGGSLDDLADEVNDGG